jgi:alanine dehydrogenase
MKIGIPREIKDDEYRVALLPAGAQMLAEAGHDVLVERGAGRGSGYEDVAYESAGARLMDDPDRLYGEAETIVKVKEPIGPERQRLRPGQTVFAFFHFAGDRALTDACLEKRITALAYETLTDASGGLPLLKPMSEVAGRMSVQEGAKYLEKPMMGRGILLGGVPGVEAGHVVILGGGVVGAHAAHVASGLGAQVVVMDIDLERLRYLSQVMPPNVQTAYSHPHALEEQLVHADLVVGAVLIPGARAPVLVSRAMLPRMKNGAVIVDVGVDQGGCIESTRPTTHQEPIFLEAGVVHYGVPNMPGAVGRTSTQALCHATQPWVLRLAALGPDEAVRRHPAFADALNMRVGSITNRAVAEAHGLESALVEHVGA